MAWACRHRHMDFLCDFQVCICISFIPFLCCTFSPAVIELGNRCQLCSAFWDINITVQYVPPYCEATSAPQMFCSFLLMPCDYIQYLYTALRKTHLFSCFLPFSSFKINGLLKSKQSCSEPPKFISVL